MTPKGPALTDGDDLPLRQIAPAFVVEGVISSAAFTPTRKDEGLLSVCRERLVTAQQAWVRHTREKGLKSVGTWGVTVAESELPCHGDPTDDPPDDAHALIDFRGIYHGLAEKRAKSLCDAAVARGRLYTPLVPT